MADAYIFDHVRTPRGRGKPDGALHEVTALALAASPLRALKERNHLDPKQVDDVVLGCVDPVGEAGGNSGRAAALVAGFGIGVPVARGRLIRRLPFPPILCRKGFRRILLRRNTDFRAAMSMPMRSRARSARLRLGPTGGLRLRFRLSTTLTAS